MNLARLLFRFGRILGKHPFTSMIFCRTERWLPLRRVARADHLVAFHHPRPSADIHILVVPTQPFPALTSHDVPLVDKARIVWKMICLAQNIAETIDPIQPWQFIINGGSRQDIGQVHGHLLCGLPPLVHDDAGYVQSADELEEWLAPHLDTRNVHGGDMTGYSLVFTWEGDGLVIAHQT